MDLNKLGLASKGRRLETHMKLVGYHLREPVFVTGPKPLLTEFGIHDRLENCECLSSYT